MYQGFFQVRYASSQFLFGEGSTPLWVAHLFSVYKGEWRRIHKYTGSRLFTGKVYYFYGGTDTLKLQGEYLEGRLISGQNFDRTGQKY